MNNTYSTKIISQALLDEVTTAIKSVSPFGSVEIFVQNNTVTQITVRNIKKTLSENPYNNQHSTHNAKSTF